MKFKYLKNVFNTNTVEMYLYDEIGGEGINAQQFADELNYIANYTSAKTVNVRINSEGGVVISGVGILSAIINANKAGKVQVDTYNDGIAASIAGVILLGGKNRYGKAFCRTMIHGVSGGDEKDLTDNDKAAMSSLTNMLSEIFTDNAGKSSKFFEGLLSNGKDNWFDCKQAVALGILTEEEPETGESLEAQDIIAGESNPSNIAKKLNSFYNQIQTQKTTDMKKVIMKLNGAPKFKNQQLADTATESQIETAVGEVIDENVALTADKAKLESEKTDLEKKLDEKDTELATVEVKNGIALGKFKAESEAVLIAQAKKDLPAFRALVIATNTPASRITDKIKNEDEADKKFEGKTIRDIEKMGKEGEKYLNTLKTTNPKSYCEVYNKTYGTKYSEEFFK